jgi:hypothetical protein
MDMKLKKTIIFLDINKKSLINKIRKNKISKRPEIMNKFKISSNTASKKVKIYLDIKMKSNNNKQLVYKNKIV